jgi:hypothetical protein
VKSYQGRNIRPFAYMLYRVRYPTAP